MKYRSIILFALTLLILSSVPLTAQSAKDRFLNSITGSPILLVRVLATLPPYMMYYCINKPNLAIIVGRCEYDSLDFSHSSEIPITGRITVLQQLDGPVAPKESPLAFNLAQRFPNGEGDLLTNFNPAAREKQYNFYGIVDTSDMKKEPLVYAVLDDVWLKAILQNPIDRKKLDPIVYSIHSDVDALKAILSVQTDIYLAFAIFRECLIAKKIESPDTVETVINTYRSNHDISRVFSAAAIHYGSPRNSESGNEHLTFQAKFKSE